MSKDPPPELVLGAYGYVVRNLYAWTPLPVVEELLLCDGLEFGMRGTLEELAEALRNLT